MNFCMILFVLCSCCIRARFYCFRKRNDTEIKIVNQKSCKFCGLKVLSILYFL